MDKPVLSKHVVIKFSVQDPSSRTEKESTKALCKAVNDNLFYTNWRLQNSSVLYRLAYLEGTLKAHDDDESLLKLAMEIKKSKSSV
jgi:hypothetical protein